MVSTEKWGFDEMIHIKFLAEFVAPWKCSINSCYLIEFQWACGCLQTETQGNSHTIVINPLTVAWNLEVDGSQSFSIVHLLFHLDFYILSGVRIAGTTTHLQSHTSPRLLIIFPSVAVGRILLPKSRRLFVDMSSLFISLFPSVCPSRQVPLDILKNCQSVPLWNHFYICSFSFTFFSHLPLFIYFFESSDSFAILTKFF